MLLDVRVRDAQLLGRVDGQPQAVVPVRAQAPLLDELGERRRLVVAPVREAAYGLRREHVDAAVDPVRDPAALAEADDDVVVAQVDDAERRLRPRDRDRRGGAGDAVCREQRVEVDVDELVAVQRVDVPRPLPLARRELDSAAPSERLRLLRDDDLRAERRQLALEELALARRARDDHARDAGAGEPTDLVRRERAAGHFHQGLRAAARGIAHPLGLAAGEDDRLHRGYRSSGSRSRVCGRTSVATVLRPIPSYTNPSARTAPGSSRLRPSMISGFAIAARTSSRARWRRSSHSVTITAASAPSTASSTDSTTSTPRGRFPGSRTTGSHARTTAPSASSRDASTIDGASRISSVFGLKARPSSATFFPRRGPRCFVSFPITRRFCSSFTSITAESSWKWYPEFDASCFSASESFGKHEPP